MNNHGQSLIETAAFFMALSVLLTGLAGFTKWFSVREKLLLAAKQGALLYSSGHWTRAETEARMEMPCFDPLKSPLDPVIDRILAQ